MVFFEEIDATGRIGGAGMSDESNDTEQTINNLLTKIDTQETVYPSAVIIVCLLESTTSCCVKMII